tara:strand:- start:1369 stop:1941 length:573 start_codon:yes stop_codon:yes gene_type:complete
MPINFNLQQIKDDFGCNLYFETGLWNVEAEDTSLCKAMTMDFDKCFSVEINPDLVSIAKLKFQEEFKEDKLEVFQGNSSNLKEYLSSIKFKETDRIVFFLDSHGHGHGCPLIEELQAIKDMNFVRKPIIILDDVRIIRDCVWSDNRYTGSNFEDILKGKLTDIDPEYKFSYLDGHIVDDCLMASVYCLNV